MSNDSHSLRWIVKLPREADAVTAERLMRSGFTSVELAIPIADGSDFESSLSRIVDSAERLRGNGIDVRSLAIAHDATRNIGSSDALARDAANEQVMGVLDAAARVGAEIVTMTAGAVFEEGGAAAVDRYEDAFHYSIKSMTSLRFEAAWRCVRIACRVCHAGFLVSPMDARRWLDDVNSAWVGASVSPSAIGRVGSPADWFRTLGHRLFVAEYSADAMDQRTDWAELIGLLRGINNACAVCSTDDDATLDAALSLGITPSPDASAASGDSV